MSDICGTQTRGSSSEEELSEFRCCWSQAHSGADGVKVNNTATVTEAEIKGTNGVIHVVDEFIEPATIAGLASGHPDFSSLVAALGALASLLYWAVQVFGGRD